MHDEFGECPLLHGLAGAQSRRAAGPVALWEALEALFANPAAYHEASRAAPARVAALAPQASAATLLRALRV